jgi:hypothetical protein
MFVWWLQVSKRSNEICLQLYEELLTDSSYLYIRGFVFAYFYCSFVQSENILKIYDPNFIYHSLKENELNARSSFCKYN